MASLLIAYIAVWLGMTLYVSWMGAKQSRLDAQLRALTKQLDESNTTQHSIARAA
jgi:CcmD family protein